MVKIDMKTNLPLHWKLKRLGDVCEIVMGQSPESIYYNENGDGLPFFQGKAEFTDVHPVAKKWCSKPKKLAEKNDILLSVRAPVGTVNIANEKCCIGRGLAAIRYDNYRYIFYFLKSVEKELDKKGTGTTFKAVSGEIVKNLQIPIPPLPEQEQIVAKIEELFSELDAGIENIKTAQEQLKVYRQSLLKWAFEGKLTNEDECLGWTIKEVGEFAKVKGGKRLPKGASYSESKTKYPYIRVTDFERQSINVNNLKYLSCETQEKIKRYTISSDDVYISIAGTIGATGTIPEILSGANLTENAAKICEISGCDKKYLSLFLSSINGQTQIKEKTKTTTQPKLSLYRIESIQIPIPPLSEQLKIVEELESRLTVCDKLEEDIKFSLARAESLRQSILKQAFEGKLVNFKGETDK